MEQEFAKKAKKGPVKPIPSAPVRKDQIGHFPEFGKKGRCQDVRELQKSPASNAKSIFALHLQQKTIAFYCFIHIKLCYDFSLFSAIYQKKSAFGDECCF